MNRFRERFLRDEYYPVLLVWAFALACGSLLSGTAFVSFGAWKPVSVFWLIVGATAGPLWVFLITNRRTGRYAILLSLLFVVLLALFGRKGIGHFLLWIVGTSEDIEFPDARYSVILILAVQWVIGLVSGFLMRERTIRRILPVVFALLLLFFALRGTETDRLGTAVLFTLVIMLGAEQLRNFAGRVMVSLAPFFLLIFFFLMIAPASPEPYRWEWIHDTVERVNEFVRRERRRIDYYLGRENQLFVRFAGYSENGGLGGVLLPSERDYLSVTFQSVPRTAIYLTGRYYDTFTGEDWELSEEAKDVPLVDGLYTDDQISYMQWVYNAYRMDPEFPEDYVKENTGTIHYEDVFTKTIFYPARSKSLSANPPFDPARGADIEFDKPRGMGSTVKYVYLQLNIGSEKLDDLLRNVNDIRLTEEEKTEILTEIRRTLRIMVPEDIDEILAQREARIHAVYGCGEDCPGIDAPNPHLSERTREFLLRIREEAQGDPVLEVELLNGYLQSLSYTTLPDITLGDEFLDRFLFEGREGYCSHFASAFVLLARELGLPARYVQGFAGDTARKNLVLTANEAHAWAEVYLDGVGWYPIECSPGYGGLINRPWSVEHVQRPVSGGALYEEEEYPEETGDDLEEILPSEETGESHLGILILAVLAAGALLSAAAVFRLEFRRKQKLAPADRYRYLIACAIAVLSEEGLKREPDETLRDYRVRIARSEELRAAAELEEDPGLRESTVYRIPGQWFDEYEAFRYRGSGREVTEKMLSNAREVLDALLAEYERSHPRLRSIFLRISLLFMNQRS